LKEFEEVSISSFSSLCSS